MIVVTEHTRAEAPPRDCDLCKQRLRAGQRFRRVRFTEGDAPLNSPGVTQTMCLLCAEANKWRPTPKAPPALGTVARIAALGLQHWDAEGSYLRRHSAIWDAVEAWVKQGCPR